ncbi:DinB family protein [Hymenobacter elongatus]|uniref:DinB family protein n=1 Tax=Hymenobacter elongatus TaxID=877208 RepID=A0A4Z0PP94_9BACT|nr:DinB family protein [Hymenobacter elongatus]TGE18323.1 DinB family protein [Hymenobacter elongatus]
MNTATQPSLQTALSQELKRELMLTRRMLERVPTEQFAWQPHPKSMKMGTLASHMANLVGFLQMSLQGPETDMATVTPVPSPTDTDEVLRRFDINAENIHQALADVDDDTFHSMWTMRRGEQVFMQLPRTAVARVLVLNHLIHHRGQMSVYLRLLDIPVPAVYGGSADEAPVQ